jgi:DMSO/TMAO reductase YedYZ molybdopterin-dependent catalytic subunit
MEDVTNPVVPSRPAGAAAGLLAAGVALGVSELGAGITGGRSLVVSVGDWVINHAPDALVEFGKRNFGTDDKAVLVTMVVVLSLVVGALLGLVARRRFLVGALGFVAFGIAGFLAALADPLHDAVSAAFAAIAGVAAGVVVLWALLRAATPAGTVPVERVSSAGFERRVFLGLVAGAAVVAAGSALVGRSLLASGTRAVAAARRVLHLPPASNPVVPPTAAMDVGVAGVTPLVTANGDFYRIDTALTFPQIDHEQWHLRIHGMVSTPVTVTFDDLAAMELIEQYATIQCVSNDVGGNLVSTAAWRGVRLRDLLARAGVAGDADQVVGRSVEGFTVGFPTSAALDDRGAMVAIGMNGVPLPIEHGFPARLIVPGLYGYVSATKWLSDIELTRFDRYDAYWVQRGWTQQGPIETQSRIDIPTSGRELSAKTVAVAGVAWAPTRGIAKVEVQVDEGAWREATLADALSTDTWRQWVYRWDANPGDHRLRVRATDGTGALQDGHDQPPGPSGATGYHTVNVTVTR